MRPRDPYQILNFRRALLSASVCYGAIASAITARLISEGPFAVDSSSAVMERLWCLGDSARASLPPYLTSGDGRSQRSCQGPLWARCGSLCIHSR